MPEPILLKIVTDADDSGINRVNRGMDNLQMSSHKASHAVKSFVENLSQARDASDVAASALGAFSKILGSSLAATGIVIAGKAIVEAYTKVSEIVEQTKERIAKASADISKSGTDISFGQASSEAKRLSDEADNARESITKLDKSYLSGLIATITGAREELSRLAGESEQMAQQRLLAGATAERKKAEERVGLTGPQLSIRDVQDKLAQDLANINPLTPEGIKAGIELAKKAEIDINAIRQKSFDDYEQKQAQQELKLIEGRIAGAEAAAKIARQSDAAAEQKAKETIRKLEEDRAKAQEKLNKRTEELQKDALSLEEKKITAQEKVNDARERLIKADADVAKTALAASGSGRGVGQRKTSAEVGAEAAANRARIAETQKQANQAYQDFKKTQAEKGLPGDKNAFQRDLADKLKQEAERQARQPQAERQKAKDGLAEANKYLSKIQDVLQSTLQELKSYAHAT